MSGLYNAVLGDGHEEERGGWLSGVIDLDDRPARYRDSWVEEHDGKPVVVMYTRTGGGNREDYQDSISAMQANPNYIKDHDDPYDSTYAMFYFRVPEENEERVRPLIRPPRDFRQEWADAMEAFEKHDEAGRAELIKKVAEHVDVIQINPT